MRVARPADKANYLVLEGEDDSDSAATVNPLGFFLTRRYPIDYTYLALKRRKLLVIKGRLKAGRFIYFEDDLSAEVSGPPSSISSTGITCCNNLPLISSHIEITEALKALKREF